MSKVFLAASDFWEAVYIDGEILCQGHSVDLEDVVRALGHEFEDGWFDPHWMDERGYSSFPSELGEWSKQGE